MILNLLTNSLRKAKRYYLSSIAKKIIIGSAHIPVSGWLITDKDTLDITKRESFAKYWRPNTRALFLAEHVWEHLTLEESAEAIKNCFEFLRCGGRLRIAVPDGYHPDSEYIEYVRPNGTGSGAEDHKLLYTYKLLSSLMQEAGFQVELLEYWDEQGVFHFQEWSSNDGHVIRSKRYDIRNKEKLTYTSLIIDGIK